MYIKDSSARRIFYSCNAQLLRILNTIPKILLHVMLKEGFVYRLETSNTSKYGCYNLIVNIQKLEKC